MQKTSVLKDAVARSQEEFAVYFPRALKVVDQRALNRMGLSMSAMVDVFRSVYIEGFMRASVVTLEELNAMDKGKST